MLLALLNSRPAAFYFKQVCAALEGPGEAYLRFFGQYLESFPVKLPESQSEQARLLRFVDELTESQRHADAARDSHVRTVNERHVGFASDRIDKLVYELYGFTPEEITIIEEATA